MKKIVITYLFCLCAMVANAANYSEQIRAFYKTYLYNTMMGDSNVALCKRNLTSTLIDKMERVTYITGADAIIRAQDATSDMIESLTVRALGNDWYMVSYYGSKDYSTERVEIPLKMEHDLIAYIVPQWNGAMYGDSTLQPIAHPAIDAIRQTDTNAFLTDFYSCYTAAYCSMQSDLAATLVTLQARYLSAHARTQFEAAAIYYAEDGVDGYDLLIDNMDFDCLWQEGLGIKPMGSDNYEISYREGNAIHRIQLSLSHSSNGYLIDTISIPSR